MVPHSVSKWRRWKSLSMPDTSAHSVERTPLSDTQSVSGTARDATRQLLVEHTQFRKSKEMEVTYWLQSCVTRAHLTNFSNSSSSLEPPPLPPHDQPSDVWEKLRRFRWFKHGFTEFSQKSWFSYSRDAISPSDVWTLTRIFESRAFADRRDETIETQYEIPRSKTIMIRADLLFFFPCLYFLLFVEPIMTPIPFSIRCRVHW